MAIHRARAHPRHRSATWWTLWWAIRRQAAFELLSASTPPAAWSILRRRLAGQRWRSTARELARLAGYQRLARELREDEELATTWRAAPWAQRDRAV